MKNRALFSSKDKCKILKCHLLQFLFDPLRVNSCLRLHFGLCLVGHPKGRKKKIGYLGVKK